jgi:hypothetical protein
MCLSCYLKSEWNLGGTLLEPRCCQTQNKNVIWMHLCNVIWCFILWVNLVWSCWPHLDLIVFVIYPQNTMQCLGFIPIYHYNFTFANTIGAHNEYSFNEEMMIEQVQRFDTMKPQQQTIFLHMFHLASIHQYKTRSIVGDTNKSWFTLISCAMHSQWEFDFTFLWWASLIGPSPKTNPQNIS